MNSEKIKTWSIDYTNEKEVDEIFEQIAEDKNSWHIGYSKIKEEEKLKTVINSLKDDRFITNIKN